MGSLDPYGRPKAGRTGDYPPRNSLPRRVSA